jgi:coproporphyrinogen III oxidase-like Fe-S oxidoreductase
MFVDGILSTSFRVATQVLLNLQPTRSTRLPAPRPDHNPMLYLHIPFCESLCPYCSFNRYIFHEPAARAYFASLREDMRQTARRGYRFSSLYIGGGTPTILVDELALTIDLARDLFGVREVSCETNPNHLTLHLADVLNQRVQRLSVGVQSFDDDLLKKINRYDRFGSGQDTLARIRMVADRFASLNVDMIFNFPGQDEAILRRDLRAAISSGANQITFYPLMTSPSVERALQRTLGAVEHNAEMAMYELIVEELSRSYELSTAWTFSRRGGGLIDEYIVESEEYLGLGSGAFSFLNGALYVNTFSLDAYRQAVSARRWPVAGMRRFKKMDQMRYRFMMDLFGLHLDKKRFQERFGLSVELALPLEMAFFGGAGAFAENSSDSITLTPRGRYLLVVMMREFFSSINRIRDQARLAVERAENEQTRRLLHDSQAEA